MRKVKWIPIAIIGTLLMTTLFSTGFIRMEKTPETTVQNLKVLQQPKNLKLSIFIADKERVSSGVEGEYGFVKPVTVEVPYTLGTLRAAIGQLKGKTIPASVNILGISIINRVATIDFSKELLTAPDRLSGTLGGTVFMQSIVFTSTQFPSVDAVSVLVEGKNFDDGHIIWNKPIGRKDL